MLKKLIYNYKRRLFYLLVFLNGFLQKFSILKPVNENFVLEKYKTMLSARLNDQKRKKENSIGLFTE